MNDTEINVRKTHPNLYWLLMFLALTGIALGLNFIILQPTFAIWDAPNALWGLIFLVLSGARIFALNIRRRLLWVRATMFFSAAYMAFLAVGTSVPGWESLLWPEREGTASFQLPIIYAGMALLQLPLLREPFVNPETANK